MSNLPAFGSSWRNYDYSGGTGPVDYIAQGPPAASTSESGGLSGMAWPMAIATIGSSLIQGVLGSSAANKSADAARRAANQAAQLEREKMLLGRDLSLAQYGAQSQFADQDVFRQFGGLKYGTDFMAQSPEFARNFTRDVSSQMALAGQSPTRIAFARRLFA